MKKTIFKNNLPGPVYITESMRKNSRRMVSEAAENKPGCVVAIYDDPNCFDRYTVVCGVPHEKNGADFFDCLCLSDNCDSHQGVSQWSECMDGPHLGKKVDFDELPDNVRNCIIARCGGAKEVSEAYADLYDYWADEDIFIGRTNDYYSEEDDDSVFQKPMWMYSENAIKDGVFAPESAIYKLTDEGKSELSKWLDNYQTGYNLGNGRSKWNIRRNAEEEYQYLTDPENGLAEEYVEDASED